MTVVKAKERVSRHNRKATVKSKTTEMQILEAAVDCVNDLGYHRTNMARISEKAGVTRGCLLYYFSNNTDLMKAVSEHIVDRMCHLLDEIVQRSWEFPDKFERILSESLTITKDRYFNAWVELLASARNDEQLMLIVNEGSRRLDLTRKRRNKTMTWEERGIDPKILDIVYDTFMLYTVGSILIQPPHDSAARSENLVKILKKSYQYLLLDPKED